MNDLAVTHAVQGNIYSDDGNLEACLTHANEGIRYYEMANGIYRAGSRRFNVAVALG